jgi:hypothetical protein
MHPLCYIGYLNSPNLGNWCCTYVTLSLLSLKCIFVYLYITNEINHLAA